MRRLSREIALQVLFQTEFAPQIPIKQILELYRSVEEDKDIEADSTDANTLTYAQELAEGVQKYKLEIDQKIQRNSQHWKLERMATVDRNILRIAIFEILYMKNSLTPNIAINEAVEIAKKFSTTESAAFINGLLDQARIES